MFPFSRTLRVRSRMAAASSKGRAIAGSFGKRFTGQIWDAKHCDVALLLISRGVSSHSSSDYDEDIEESVRPALVPNHVIGIRSEKYWGPHPTTGVFVPNAPKAGVASSVSVRPNSPESGSRGSSALDQTVRFRQLDIDDLDPDDPK